MHVMEDSLEVNQQWGNWAFFLVVLLGYLYGLRPFSRWQLRQIPGPRGWWLLGNIPDVLQEGIAAINIKYAKRYGPVFKISYGKYVVVAIANADLARQVLRHSPIRPAWWPAADLCRDFHQGMTTSLVLANGPLWKALRSAWQPVFFSSSLQNYCPLMQEAADLFVNDVREASKANKSVDIQRLAGSLAFDVIARAGLGLPSSAQLSRQAAASEPKDRQYWSVLQDSAFTFFKSAAGSPWVVLYMLFPFSLNLLRQLRFYFPEPLLESIIASRKRLEDAVYELLSGICVCPELGGVDLPKGLQPGAFMGRLHQTLDPRTGQTLSQDIQAQQGVVMLLAGYETSSSTIANASYLLSHPHTVSTLECLKAEVNGLCPEPAPGDVLGLPYLDAVLKETLRILPPAHVTAREAPKTMTVGGYRIHKGQWLMIPIYAIHHDPETWGEDAHIFRPERWVDGSPDQKAIQAKAFLPFGDGPRSCPGGKFALQEAKLALFQLIRHFDISLQDPEVIFRVYQPTTLAALKLRHSSTMAPAHGVWIKCSPRTAVE